MKQKHGNRERSNDNRSTSPPLPVRNPSRKRAGGRGKGETLNPPLRFVKGTDTFPNGGTFNEYGLQQLIQRVVTERLQQLFAGFEAKEGNYAR